MTRILGRITLLTFALLLAATAANANSANLTFNNAYGAAYPGTGDLTYPYDFTINGQGGNELMCIDFNNHITNGESWVADTSTITTASPLALQQAAYLFLGVLHGVDNSVDANGLIWYLVDGGNAPTLDAGSLALEASLPASFSANQLAGIILYTPQNFSQNSPQRFLGATPEPSTLAMMGSGFIALAGVVRRKLKA